MVLSVRPSRQAFTEPETTLNPLGAPAATCHTARSTQQELLSRAPCGLAPNALWAVPPSAPLHWRTLPSCTAVPSLPLSRLCRGGVQREVPPSNTWDMGPNPHLGALDSFREQKAILLVNHAFARHLHHFVAFAGSEQQSPCFAG